MAPLPLHHPPDCTAGHTSLSLSDISPACLLKTQIPHLGCNGSQEKLPLPKPDHPFFSCAIPSEGSGGRGRVCALGCVASMKCMSRRDGGWRFRAALGLKATVSSAGAGSTCLALSETSGKSFSERDAPLPAQPARSWQKEEGQV